METQRNSGRERRNVPYSNYGNQRENNYDTNSFRENRPFGRTANYSDYDNRGYQNDYNERFNDQHESYGNKGPRTVSRRRQANYNTGSKYKAVGLNRRNIERENGGYSEGYNPGYISSGKDVQNNAYYTHGFKHAGYDEDEQQFYSEGRYPRPNQQEFYNRSVKQGRNPDHSNRAIKRSLRNEDPAYLGNGKEIRRNNRFRY
jgi:hypothetical protein